MKKVLSVVLAAAMVLGMSVSAFADANFGAGTASTPVEIGNDAANKVTWDLVAVVRNKKVVTVNNESVQYDELKSGDVLYFPVNYGGSAYTEEAPKNWVIRASSDEYVESAKFYRDDVNTMVSSNGWLTADVLYVAVTLGDIDAFSNEDVDLYFYIYDKDNKTRSEKVSLNYESYVNEITLTEDDLDWVITVDEPTVYTYKKGEKAAVATFNYEDLDVYFSAKLYSGDKYNVSASTKYNKDLSKEYDTDVEVITLTGDFDRVGELVFKAAKDNKQVVEVVDGELVPVEAEYVKNHKFANGTKVNGYVVDTAELGSYALIDADIEIEVEETKTETTTPSTDKTNPSTGANDFVGAAVALAVVSVAAAGALAFKK